MSLFLSLTGLRSLTHALSSLSFHHARFSSLIASPSLVSSLSRPRAREERAWAQNTFLRCPSWREARLRPWDPACLPSSATLLLSRASFSSSHCRPAPIGSIPSGSVWTCVCAPNRRYSTLVSFLASIFPFLCELCRLLLYTHSHSIETVL